MASHFNFDSFPGYKFLISVIVFSLVKCHHRLPFKTNCWHQELVSYLMPISHKYNYYW